MPLSHARIQACYVQSYGHSRRDGDLDDAMTVNGSIDCRVCCGGYRGCVIGCYSMQADIPGLPQASLALAATVRHAANCPRTDFSVDCRTCAYTCVRGWRRRSRWASVCCHPSMRGIDC